MGILNIFTRKPRAGAPTPPNKAGMLNRAQSFGGADATVRTFTPYNANTSYVPPPATMACVRIIVSRAMQAKLEGSDPVVHADYTPLAWWGALFESVLIHGNAIIYKRGGELRFAPFGSVTPNLDRSKASWRVNEYVPSRGTTVDRVLNFKAAAVARWEQGQGQSLLGASPAKLADAPARAYDHAVQLVSDYAAFGHKIGSYVKLDSAVNDPDRMTKYLNTIDDVYKKKGSFHGSYTEYGADLRALTHGAPPALAEAVEQAVIAVCRVYNVPTQLLGITPKGVRVSPEELQSHLLSDAVTPLLNTVADAVSRVWDRPVRFNTLALQPSLSPEKSQAMLRISQAGYRTINELRELDGLSRHPEGDVFPQTAGAATRENERSGSGDEGQSSS